MLSLSIRNNDIMTRIRRLDYSSPCWSYTFKLKRLDVGWSASLAERRTRLDLSVSVTFKYYSCWFIQKGFPPLVARLLSLRKGSAS
jgi:hypothetical protein